jgi:hypothetical protein
MPNYGDYSSPENIPLSVLEKKYKPEDFSQLAINRGQRIINGELTELAKTFAKTLKALHDAIKGSSVGSQVNFGAIENDITTAIARSEKVAGYYPPGCNYSPPGGGGGEGTGGGPQG